MENEQAGKEDLEGGYRRARRALRHLWGIHRGLKDYSPNDCDGCKEIHHFLTDPTYRGDTHYPMYDRIDPDWKLGPDEMEINRSSDLKDCPVCDGMQPVIREENGDATCSVCQFIYPEA